MRRLSASLRVLWRSGGRIYAIGAGAAWLVGFMFIFFLVQNFPSATLMASYAALYFNGMYSMFGGLFVWGQSFRELIHFGVKRKTAVLACICMTLGMSLALLLACFLLYVVGMGGLNDAGIPLPQWISFIGLYTLIWLLAALTSLIVHRFGMNGMTVAYIVFMGIILFAEELMPPILAAAEIYPVPFIFGTVILLLIILWRLYKISA